MYHFYLLAIIYHPYTCNHISVMYTGDWCCIDLYHILEDNNLMALSLALPIIAASVTIYRHAFTKDEPLWRDFWRNCFLFMHHASEKVLTWIRAVISEDKSAINWSPESTLSLQCRSSLHRTRRCLCQMEEAEPLFLLRCMEEEVCGALSRASLFTMKIQPYPPVF